MASLFSEIFEENQKFQQLFQDNRCAFAKTNYAVLFPVVWCILRHSCFSVSCNFIFGAKKWLISVKNGRFPDLV